MRSTDLGMDYADLAHLLVESCDGSTDGIFFYAEVEPNVIGAGLFHDVGNSVDYIEPNDDITDRVLEIWEKLDESEQWRVIRCRIMSGKFEASFEFPGDIDETESEVERRPRALKSVFGDKPVVYPPFDR